ncbi:hypothetical protein RRG08_033351 [Elysia crispata]|uniref:Uncharacterized protein n=1 Tax=Elysia crispata TaxID=231223 RepID=A0AAE0Z7G0_9GAST|nr:hypothetical protein RRG08_033351 [Elysia crispata]
MQEADKADDPRAINVERVSLKMLPQIDSTDSMTLRLLQAVDYNKEDRRVIDQTPMTIRVITGQTASLPCTVDPRYTEQHADQYKVSTILRLFTC